MLTYKNKKGNVVEVKPTFHAYKRFKERFFNLVGDNLDDKQVPLIFERMFNNSIRVLNLNQQEKSRLKRHGQDSMFFRNPDFTFVVKNSTIITVEISLKGKRHLNKKAR